MIDLKTGLFLAAAASVALVALLAVLEVDLFFQVLAAIAIASGLTALLDGAQ